MFDPFKLVAYLQQIFYLDNNDYGAKTIKNMNIPRVLEFKPEIISSLVITDCVGLKGGPPSRVFGAGKVRL